MDEIIKMLTENFVQMILGTAVDSGGVEVAKLTLDSNVLAFSNKLYGLFALLGIAYSGCCFTAELNKTMLFESNNITMLSIFKPFAKFALSLAILSRSAKILSGFLGYHNALIKWADTNVALSAMGFATGNINANAIDTATIADQLVDGAGFWTKVALIFFGLLMWIVGLVVTFVFNFKALQYKIELLFKVGLAPLAMADVYSGMNSNAVKYLKSLLALFIYGACFIIVPRLASFIQMNEVESIIKSLTSGGTGAVKGVLEVLGSLIQLVIAPIASLGALSVCKQVAKEVLS